MKKTSLAQVEFLTLMVESLVEILAEVISDTLIIGEVTIATYDAGAVILNSLYFGIADEMTDTNGIIG